MVGTALRVQRRYSDDAGNQLAAAIAFFGFLSLFPLILIALAVAGFVLADDPAAQAEVAATITDAIPGFAATLGGGDTQVAAALEATVDRRQQIGVVALLLLLFSGLRVVDAGMTATARVAARGVSGNPFVLRARQISALVVLGLVALAGAAASSAAGVEMDGVLTWALGVGGAVLSFVLDTALFAGAYRMLSPPPRPPFGQVLPGAVMGATGWTALKVAGAAYVGRQVASANALYGTLGGVIGLLLLLFLAGRLYVYGAELNEVLAARRRPGGGDGSGGGGERARPVPAGASTPRGRPSRTTTPTVVAHDTWDAGAYRRHSGLQTGEAMALLARLDPRPGELVLDVGCGDGRVTAEIAATGARAVGLDRSPSMATSAVAAGLDAVVGDATALPFPGGCFDAVFSNAALHWVSDQQRALREVARVLGPHGRFVARVGAAGNQWRLATEMLRLLTEPPYAPFRPAGHREPWRMADPSEWAGVLLDEGFRLEHFEVVASTAGWDSPTAMRGWLASVSGSITGLLPARLRDRYLDEVVARTWGDLDPATAFVRLEVHAVRA